MAEKPLAAVAGIKPRFLFYLRRTGHTLLWVIAMKKNRRRLPQKGRPELRLALAVLAGAAVGSTVPEKIPFARAMAEGGSLRAALWPELILLMVLFVSGFMRRGGLPATLAIAGKGMLLAAETGLRASALKPWGLPAAAALSFAPGFLTMTAMLLLARQCLLSERLRTDGRVGREARPDSAFFLTALVGFLAVLVAGGLRLWLMPELWSAAVRLLSQQ
jgi:hypothetical protein